MTEDPNIPDDWFPLGNIEATSKNADGGIFLYPTTRNSISVIQYHEDSENDVIRMYDTEVARLTRRLLEYLADELDHEPK